MEEKSHKVGQRNGCCVLVLLLQSCIMISVVIALFILYSQIQNLQRQIAVVKLSRDTDLTDEKSRRAVLNANNFFQDLLQAQEHILESHCANDSRLCMRGPKGDKGDPAVLPPSVLQSLNASCVCLEKPVIRNSVKRDLNSTAGNDVFLICKATGNPEPYVKWTKNGVTVSHDDALILKNAQTSNSGVYQCSARNIVGSDTMTVSLNII